MSIPCRSERSLLGQAELEMVRATHHPAIYALDGKELHALQGRSASDTARRGRWQDKSRGRCEARLINVERAFRAAPNSH